MDAVGRLIIYLSRYSLDPPEMVPINELISVYNELKNSLVSCELVGSDNQGGNALIKNRFIDFTLGTIGNGKRCINSTWC